MATKILLGPKLPDSILDIARSLTPAGFELTVADQGTPQFYEAAAEYLGLELPPDRAPDFALPDLYDKTRHVKLSSYQGKKPVVLIFGSYT